VTPFLLALNIDAICSCRTRLLAHIPHVGTIAVLIDLDSKQTSRCLIDHIRVTFWIVDDSN
jgi:hypothetical protein